jgi:arylsulfatase A-like enzyme
MKQILVFILLLFSISGFSQTSSKPNVIIIYFDDMGYGDIEPFGMTGIHTPNFNRLAAEGLRLTNYNTVQAVCTASRAALLTGTYTNRLGLAGALLPGAKVALNPEEQTIASLLKDNGYKTAMLGKWHLGNNPPYFPMNFGFDSFYGLPYSHDIWPIDYAGKLITDPANWRGTWPPLPVIEGDKEIATINTLAEQAQWTPTLTEKAVAYIKSNKKNPFFLYLAHPMPHVPLAVSEKFKGKSKLGLFGDVMMELDWSLGQVLETLDKENLSKNTILIVMSDNGPWLNFGNHAGSAAGFKEGKGTAFEGGTRVPFLIRWPQKIKAGYVTGELMTNMDVLPTISAMTGSMLPKKKIDGLNFMPLLLSKTENGPRESFYYYYNQNSLKAVRYKHWKLVLSHTSQSYENEKPGKDGFPGKIAQIEVRQALYNLAHDPGEKVDLQELYPEVVAEIMKLVETAREDLGDDLTKREGNNRRKAAVVE